METTQTAPETTQTPAAPETEPSPLWTGPKKRRKWIKRVLVIAAVLALLFWIVVRPMLGGTAAVSGAYQPAQVQRQDLTVSVSGSGTVTPIESYQVSALVTGEILESPFEDGDQVEKDQLLYRIDPGSAQTALQQAQLSVQQAQMNYDTLASSLQVKAIGGGVVQTLHVQEGDLVSAGTAIADITDTSTMTLTVPFQAGDAAHISAGQTAQVTLSGTLETLTGTVESVASADQVGNGGALVRQVKIRLTNPGALTDATTATARVGNYACASGGALSPRLRQTITAAASGEITSLNVSVGSRVSAGTVLAAIGGESAENSLADAALAVQNAQLSLQSAQEALDSFLSRDVCSYREIVFCGYGEPTYRIDDIVWLVDQLKERFGGKLPPVRINTNGHANLIQGRDVIPDLKGRIDTLSISLNANTAAEYVALCHPVQGEAAYQAMLDFAKEAKNYVPHVVFTVVDKGTAPEEIEESRRIADSLGVKLRVRSYIDS